MARRSDVRDTYDRIADHFAKTRAEPWEEVASFLEGRRGDVGLDVGVGNGRHAELLSDRTATTVGLDVSRAILGTARDRAREHGFEVSLALADATALPIAADAVDLSVYVATIHHLSTRDRRVRSLDELARVLSSEGIGIVSAWSTTHDRFDRTSGFDTTIDWTLPDGRRLQRFYHIYDPNEFRGDVTASDLTLVELLVSGGNCYAIVRAP